VPRGGGAPCRHPPVRNSPTPHTGTGGQRAAEGHARGRRRTQPPGGLCWQGRVTGGAEWVRKGGAWRGGGGGGRPPRRGAGGGGGGPGGGGGGGGGGGAAALPTTRRARRRRGRVPVAPRVVGGGARAGVGCGVSGGGAQPSSGQGRRGLVGATPRAAQPPAWGRAAASLAWDAARRPLAGARGTPVAGQVRHP